MDMLNIFVCVYLDDILIFLPALQEHIQHLRRVLQHLLENCLFVKAEKCVFHGSSVTYLGLVMSADGISMDTAKGRAVIDCPVPTLVWLSKDIWGLLIFYHQFIINYFICISVKWPPLLHGPMQLKRLLII